MDIKKEFDRKSKEDYYSTLPKEVRQKLIFRIRKRDSGTNILAYGTKILLTVDL